MTNEAQSHWRWAGATLAVANEVGEEGETGIMADPAMDIEENEVDAGTGSFWHAIVIVFLALRTIMELTSSFGSKC